MKMKIALILIGLLLLVGCFNSEPVVELTDVEVERVDVLNKAIETKDVSVCNPIDNLCRAIVTQNETECYNDSTRPLDDLVWCISNYAIYYETPNVCDYIEDKIASHENATQYKEGVIKSYCLEKYEIGKMF